MMTIMGTLLYITSMRTNFFFAVSYISRFMTTPRDKHLTASKMTLKYIHGTLDFCIMYNETMDFQLTRNNLITTQGWGIVKWNLMEDLVFH